MKDKRMKPGQWTSIDASDYDQKWKDMEAAGQSAHGEANFVRRFSPTSVLDAGCGTGRIAIELATHNIDVVGVDLDDPFITQAKSKAPELDFHVDNLATVQLDRTFDVVVMAGNVMIFVAPGTEGQVITNMADHLEPGGRLISGFQLERNLTIEYYNAAATNAGLTLAEHWCSWDGEPATESSTYAVLVHQARA